MNRATVLRPTLAALAVLWLFLVIFNYYVVHKPFSAENALALADSFASILVACLMCALAVGIGTRVLRRIDFTSRLQAFVFRAGLGFGVISFATFALGLAGLLSRPLFWALLVGLVIVLREEIRENVSKVDLRGLIENPFDKLLAAYLALSLAFSFVVALTPPIEWDEQLYHLLEGKSALLQGRIMAPPDIPTFNYPSLVEMLYLAALVLKGDVVAKLIHWSFGVLAIGAVWDCARQTWNVRVAWLAAATLGSIPTLVKVMGLAYSDAALALYAFGAFYAVEMARRRKSAGWLALAGAFAGCALGTKNTAMIIPVALAILIWRPNRQAFAHTAVFLALAFAFAVPWYIRNFLFVGNPIYPYFFGGKYWDSFRAAWGTRWGTGLLQDPLRLAIAPWDATIFGQEGTVAYSATLGPLMLAFLPLLLLTLRLEPGRVEDVAGKEMLRDALIFSSIGYLFWLLGVAATKLLQQSRYLVPIFPTLALAAGVAVERLRGFTFAAFSMERFAKAVLALVLVFTLAAQLLGLVALNPWPYLAGLEARDQYLARRLGRPGYYAAMQALKTLPPNSRVLFLWEPLSYYAPYPTATQPDQLLDAFPDLNYRFHDAQRIVAHLHEDGFTHILLNRAGLDSMLQSGYDPITGADLQSLQDLASQHLKLIYGETPLEIVAREGKPAVSGAEDDPYAIYEIVLSEAR